MNTRLGKFLLSFTLFFLMLYVAFVNYTEPTQIGIARNRLTGKMWAQTEGGFHLTPPWVWVVRIDLRPMRVAVNSGGRGYSAKLVQFQKDEWEKFVEVEGWRYYWWSNRLSFNFGYDDEYRGFRDIMRGHAYGATEYSFIKTIEYYKTR